MLEDTVDSIISEVEFQLLRYITQGDMAVVINSMYTGHCAIHSKTKILSEDYNANILY